MTSTADKTSVNCTSSMAWRIELLRSNRMFMFTAAGSLAWKDGRMRLMASTVSMVLAPGWRCTASTMARLSTFQLAMRMFSTLSIGVATSSRRTGAPLRQVTMSGR